MDELIRPKDVQKIFRCSLPYVYKLASDGRLRHVRIPAADEPGKERKRVCNVIRFRKRDVLDFIDENLS